MYSNLHSTQHIVSAQLLFSDGEGGDEAGDGLFPSMYICPTVFSRRGTATQ